MVSGFSGHRVTRHFECSVPDHPSLHPVATYRASRCARHHPDVGMERGAEPQPLVRAAAWLTSGGEGDEVSGWNAPQETWHLALVRTPAPPRAFPGPHLAPPPPRQLFPPRGLHCPGEASGWGLSWGPSLWWSGPGRVCSAIAPPDTAEGQGGALWPDPPMEGAYQGL